MEDLNSKRNYDFDGMRRVARTLLKHINPRSRTEAYQLIYSGLGAYMLDRAALAAEVDRYIQKRSGMVN